MKGPLVIAKGLIVLVRDNRDSPPLFLQLVEVEGVEGALSISFCAQ